jgi:hypothetical protein
MNRLDPVLQNVIHPDEERNAFLDELFNNLFDNDDISSESDKIFNLSKNAGVLE